MSEVHINEMFVLETARYASIFTPGARPALELEHNIAFIMNVSAIQDAQERTLLAPGHILRKATAQEILAVKDVLKDYGAFHWTAWECDKKKTTMVRHSRDYPKRNGVITS